jgi:hypothetical protein
MTEILRYVDSDLDVVLNKMIKFENLIEYTMIKTQIVVDVETEVKYYFEDDQWEGVIVVSHAEGGRKNNKTNIS